MIELLSRLTAIMFYSKTVHYNCKGQNAYSDHLLADKMIDELDGFKDDINEVCFLGENEDTPLSKDVIEGALKFLPEEKQEIDMLFKSLDDLIVETIQHIQDLIDGELSVGEENLLGSIAQDLQFKHGLLHLRLK